MTFADLARQLVSAGITEFIAASPPRQRELRRGWESALLERGASRHTANQAVRAALKAAGVGTPRGGARERPPRTPDAVVQLLNPAAGIAVPVAVYCVERDELPQYRIMLSGPAEDLSRLAGVVQVRPPLPCIVLSDGDRECGKPAGAATLYQLPSGGWAFQAVCGDCAAAMAAQYPGVL